MTKNFVSKVIEAGGDIHPIIVDSSLTNGTGTFNPSIYNDDGRLYLNIRHCQVTLFHAEKNIFEHQWGPLSYLNPENDITLTTTNYFYEINADLSIKCGGKVDTSLLDVKPVWEFIGLEDCRVVRWNGKLYLSGVRRDTTTNGQGRIELSEIIHEQNSVREISRFRIPAPGPDNSYCEKNWMPIIDTPYHYVKWCTPTEVVEVDPENKTCVTKYLVDNSHITPEFDFRGSSQVLPYKDGYFCIIHGAYLYKSEVGRKNATYRHKFIFWDKNWKIIKTSEMFNFMGGEIEFCAGMAKYNEDYLITFGFQDNAAYILRCPEKIIEEIFYA